MNDIRQHNDIALAILPFDNVTEGNGLDVFCRSFQMDLTTELSRFRQIRVIACSSPAETGSIGTDYSLKGSVHYYNEKLKVNAQLINNRHNQVAWADRFEGGKQSIFSMQEGLLKEVVSTLQQQLNYDLLIRIRKKKNVNLTAYEHWLYGVEELKKASLEADEKARIHFQKAIDIDPTYSLAYSGMSMTYFNEWSCQLWERWDVSQKGAYEWAKKAFELDTQNYVAACVLGRIYLYDAEYETAEVYLRRALRLNPNDTDNLIQIASCFVFLGYHEEAEELYQEVLRRNPLHSNAYLSIGALIAFERGEYEKCVTLGTSAGASWVDFAGMIAAAYFYLGDSAKMKIYWQIFLEDFEKKILRAPLADEGQALQWIINVNPYREKTNLMPFWEHVSGKDISLGTRVFAKTGTAERENSFVKENDLWEISFEGRLIHLSEVKGFYDVVKLLENPDKHFHCTELAGGGLVTATEPVFDGKAKRSYQKKIQELQEEISWSEQNNDLQRCASLQKEYDEIIDHLSASLGIGRKTRIANDPLDKTRSAVTWRIRTAIRKIQKADPSLGKHLSLSIKTGLFCSYSPEKPVRWLGSDRGDPF